MADRPNVEALFAKMFSGVGSPGENETMVGGNEPSANVQMTGDTSAAQSADVSVPEDSAAESTAQKGKRKNEDDMVPPDRGNFVGV